MENKVTPQSPGISSNPRPVLVRGLPCARLVSRDGETQEVDAPQRGGFYFVCFIQFAQETYCAEASLSSFGNLIHR